MTTLLIEQINEDLKNAMRTKNEAVLGTLRMLLAALKNKRIDLGKDAILTDANVIEVIKSESRKRRDSAEAYKQGNRQDLVDKEETEIALFKKYLPEEMSAEAVEKIAADTIAELGLSGPSSFGRAMGEVMKKVNGATDGNVVSAAVKKILGIVTK